MFDRPRSKQGPIDREGPGVPQNGGNGPPTIETGVLLIGRGVAYRKTEETDFSLTSYGRNGVLLIRRGVAYRKTEEMDFSSTSYCRNKGHVHREGCGVP